MKKTKLITLLSTIALASAGAFAFVGSKKVEETKAASGTFILIGSHQGSWNNTDDNYAMTRNSDKDQYEFKDVEWAVGNSWRITWAGEWGTYAGWSQLQSKDWFEEAGSDNNVKVKTAGRYDVYFKNNDGNKIYVAKAAYTITLNKDGGSVVGDDLTGYSYGDEKTLPTLTKSGYSFDGWYGNSDLTGEAVTGIASTDYGNKEYWAKFTEVTAKYTVKFFTENGTLIETINDVSHGSSVSPTDGNPTKEGSGNKIYTFAGWVDDKGDPVDISNVQSDIEAYASFEESWKPARYLVGHYGSVDSFTSIGENTIPMVSHNTDELKATNVSLTKGDSLKLAYYDGTEVRDYYGYSSCLENDGRKWFESDTDGNIVCKADGVYSFYFKGDYYDGSHKISIASEGKTASQLACKLHSFDSYITEEEAEATGGKGYCKNNDRWPVVNAFYNDLSADEKAAFQNYKDSSDVYYSGAYARYAAWAVANNIDPVSGTALAARTLFSESNANTTWIIVVVSLASVSLLGGLLFVKRRKALNK